MKKLMIIFVFMAIFLSGCFGSDYPKDIEAQKLYEQYNSFIEQDVSSYEKLQTFINEVSLSVIDVNVIIEVKTYNQDNALIEIKKHAGFIFHIFDQDFDVITIISNPNLPANHTEQYIIYDSKGKPHEASLIRKSEEHQLSILRFSTPRLFIDKVVTISNELPLIGEPVILIGNQFKIINAISMGIVLAYEESDFISAEIMLTNIPSDANGNGGFLLNMNKEIIGIQYMNKDQVTYVILASTLRDFIDINE